MKVYEEMLEAKMAPNLVPMAWTAETEKRDKMGGMMLGDRKFNKLC